MVLTPIALRRRARRQKWLKLLLLLVNQAHDLKRILGWLSIHRQRLGMIWIRGQLGHEEIDLDGSQWPHPPAVPLGSSRLLLEGQPAKVKAVRLDEGGHLLGLILCQLALLLVNVQHQATGLRVGCIATLFPAQLVNYPLPATAPTVAVPSPTPAPAPAPVCPLLRCQPQPRVRGVTGAC